MKPKLQLKRIYDDPNPDDGLRLFVDRLWARGVSKEEAKIDLWPKELTPSTELRKWFHEDESRRVEFEQRYRTELDERTDEIEALFDSLENHDALTLVTATKDLEQGHAAILKKFLSDKL